MNHFLYPPDWSAIAYAIKDANAWRCQACGRQCRRPGEFNLGWQYQLTVAHYYQEYDAPIVFAACLCLPCHLRHDAKAVWLARRRLARYRQRQAGQMDMFAI